MNVSISVDKDMGMGINGMWLNAPSLARITLKGKDVSRAFDWIVNPPGASQTPVTLQKTGRAGNKFFRYF